MFLVLQVLERHFYSVYFHNTVRLAKKFILVGDHKQLPPVIQSEQAKDLSNTLFEELYNNDSACESTKVMLDIQHRMPEQISNFISNEFYNNQLNTFKSAQILFIKK